MRVVLSFISCLLVYGQVLLLYVLFHKYDDVSTLYLYFHL